MLRRQIYVNVNVKEIPPCSQQMSPRGTCCKVLFVPDGNNMILDTQEVTMELR